jgi:hypothetical protein
VYVKALADADPQVQVEAIRGLVRLGSRGDADALVRLTGSSDQGMSHLAVNALVSLDAVDAAVRGLDGAPNVRAGALRALAQMRTPMAVTAIIERLAKAPDAATRAALVHTLGRMYNREGYWRGDWWTTRPQHLGPYFDPAPWEESPRIRAALIGALTAARGEELKTLVDDLASNQVLPRGASALIAAVATTNEPLRVQLIEAIVGHTELDAQTAAVATQLDAKGGALHAGVAQLLAGESRLGPGSLALARTAVLDSQLDPSIRASLLTSIGQASGEAALATAVDVFSSVNPAATAPAAGVAASPVEAAWRRFVGDRRRTGELDYFINVAKSGQPPQRTLAYAVLVQSVRTPRTPPPVRDKVTPVIDAAWPDASSAPSLVEAIAIMRLEAQYAEQLAAHNQKKP